MDTVRPSQKLLVNVEALLASLEASLAALRLENEATAVVAQLQKTVDEMRAELFGFGVGH